MSERLEGGCLCGRVRFSISAPPRVVTHCHCDGHRRGHKAAAAERLRESGHGS